MSFKDEALKYHSQGRKGKIEVIATKPVATQHDLSLAYSPGVAEPCRVIAENDDAVYEYTAKGNLVAVISNGTAVLGLGNIGPHCAKPVMEGKGILFKQLADVDVFDIELNAPTAAAVIQVCQALEPTFGGINLEDIKAPDCFIIEDELKRTLNIPVFHDDQHGTAIICGAAFLNAIELTERDIAKVKTVFNGGGAAAIACANILISIGVLRENVIMCDTKGVIYKGRTEGMNVYKELFAIETERRTLAEALVDADVFVGVSVADALTPEMLAPMAAQPIIFAMANPDPEIRPEVALAARPDAIVATGRSDYPNQVNNCLGFPFIFRGALDVRASQITEGMKLAAMRALAQLAKLPVPESVCEAYGGERFEFGRNYLIPKPIDTRLLTSIAPAVAEAAMRDGVARMPLADMNAYRQHLEHLLASRGLGIKRNVRRAESPTSQLSDFSN